ncbi:MAG: hypothetical protein ACXWJM_12105 [Ramlibacter sp.]
MSNLAPSFVRAQARQDAFVEFALAPAVIGRDVDLERGFVARVAEVLGRFQREQRAVAAVILVGDRGDGAGALGLGNRARRPGGTAGQQRRGDARVQRTAGEIWIFHGGRC